jgi:hypothetical protein
MGSKIEDMKSIQLVRSRKTRPLAEHQIWKGEKDKYDKRERDQYSPLVYTPPNPIQGN